MDTHHIDPSFRVTYTPSQLEQYFDTIQLPTKHRSSPVLKSKAAANSAEGLAFLTPLIRINLDPSHLFHKMIERGHGRGGYCMENTQLLCTVLRSLGYDVLTTGARVNSAIQPISQSKSWRGPSYDNFNHMVCIVTVLNKKYLVEVGFGSNGPCSPVPLENNYSTLNVLPSHRLRLVRSHIPDSTHPDQKLWIYQLRFNDDTAWIPGYCFSETEFLPADFDAMNFFVSRSKTSWFTYTVVCLKFFMDSETEEMVGDVTLFQNEIKERRYGKSGILMKIDSEEDRVQALRKYLGVTLTEPERNGIYGMVTMIT